MSSLTISLPGQMERRTQLEECWRARLERVTELSLAYHDAAQLARDGGYAERARASRRARMLARAAVSERQALAEIEAALERISSGQYGQCEQCREPISASLLAGRPQARYCSACGWLATQPAG
jgi:DnaK suppressor protein